MLLVSGKPRVGMRNTSGRASAWSLRSLKRLQTPSPSIEEIGQGVVPSVKCVGEKSPAGRTRIDGEQRDSFAVVEVQVAVGDVSDMVHHLSDAGLGASHSHSGFRRGHDEVLQVPALDGSIRLSCPKHYSRRHAPHMVFSGIS